MSTSPRSHSPPPLAFPNSLVPTVNPLGEGKYIRTAAALMIGDEILNGKTADTNSTYFARFCFDLGIELKRIEVIADDEAEIIEASTRLVNKYDFVITSGGIGPTHDDITYQSLGKAFSQPLVHHPETIRRMGEISLNRRQKQPQNAQQKEARDRMALFPNEAEVFFVCEDLWVPVIRLQGKLCVFPGVPTLFKRLLEGLKPYLPLPLSSEKQTRILVHTPLPESTIAPFLTSLQKRSARDGIRIGSYPHYGRDVTVSLIGKNVELLKALADETVQELKGTITTKERDETQEMEVDPQ